MNILTAEQQLKEMQEKMEAVMKENESLREIAAIKQSEGLLNEEIEALKKEIEALGEQQRQKVEVEKLKKKLYDIKNADKPSSLVDNAPQYTVDALPDDLNKLETQIRLHLDRQLIGRNLGKTDKKYVERYVYAMKNYVIMWKNERNSQQFKSFNRVSTGMKTTAHDADYFSRVALKIKPIVGIVEFNRT